ncbi:hypothetical protein ACSBR1_019468 [Camellia fascicularis]
MKVKPWTAMTKKMLWPLMVNQTQDKKLKEGLTVDTTGTQGVKYKKPKPTNPKPFRLRTEKKGILKEANLERKMQALVPRKEIVAASTLPSRSLHKKHGNEIQKQSLTASEGQTYPKIATITPQRCS